MARKRPVDTTVMEYTAEDLIAHKLQRGELLAAKPKFDREGTDLLALLDVADGAKLCRIQCKGRSLVNSANSSVVVPDGYATDAFVLFLFVETGEEERTHLYCFLGREIRETWHKRKGAFVLRIKRRSFESDLAPYKFDNHKIDDIKVSIIDIDMHGEFKKAIHGYARIREAPDTLVASGTVGEQSNDGHA